MRSFVYFSVLLLHTSLCWGYANFIGHGYSSCLNCHYNPFGGGMLNDYGRVVAATGISSRDFYPARVDEEKLAYLSGFLFREPRQKRLRTQINYRGAEITRNPGGGESETKTWLPMQLDFRATILLNESETLFISGDIGRAPPPPAASQEEESKLRSRSHYLGWRLRPHLGVYVGFMDKVFGLRIAEHIAFSRSLPQVTQNDQTHGIALHYQTSNWELGAHGFVGNLAQDRELRMAGASLQIERNAFESTKVGISLKNSKNDYLDLQAFAVHSKTGFGEGASLLFELGEVQKQGLQSKTFTKSRYAILQSHLRPRRGLYVLSNIEYLHNNVDIGEDYLVRFGPGLQYFPAQRIELRADLYNTRNFVKEGASRDSWALLTQVHLWL